MKERDITEKEGWPAPPGEGRNRHSGAGFDAGADNIST